VTTDRPTETLSERYQLPVRPPVRLLLMASFSATVGSLEVIAWAAFGLPRFVLQAGTALIAVGVGLGVWALIADRRVRWILYVSASSLTIARGSRRWQQPWANISAVHLVGSRLVIEGPEGQPQHTAAVAPEARGSDMLTQMLRAIHARLGQH